MAPQFLGNPKDAQLKPPLTGTRSIALAKAFKKGASFYLRPKNPTEDVGLNGEPVEVELVIDLKWLHNKESLEECKQQMDASFPYAHATLDYKNHVLICQNPIPAYAWLYTYHEKSDVTGQQNIYHWNLEEIVETALQHEQNKTTPAPVVIAKTVYNEKSATPFRKSALPGPRGSKREYSIEGSIPVETLIKALGETASAHASLEASYALIFSLRNRIMKYIPHTPVEIIPEPKEAEIKALFAERQKEALAANPYQKLSLVEETWLRKQIHDELFTKRRNRLLNQQASSLPEPPEELVEQIFNERRAERLKQRQQNTEVSEIPSNNETSVPRESEQKQLNPAKAEDLRNQVYTELWNQGRAAYVRQHIQPDLNPARRDLDKRFNELRAERLAETQKDDLSPRDAGLLMKQARKELRAVLVDTLLKEHNATVPKPSAEAIQKRYETRVAEILRTPAVPKHSPATKEKALQKRDERKADANSKANKKDDLSPRSAHKLRNQIRSDIRNDIRKEYIEYVPNPGKEEITARFEKRRDELLQSSNKTHLPRRTIKRLMEEAESELRNEIIDRLAEPSEQVITRMFEQRRAAMEKTPRTELPPDEKSVLMRDVIKELRDAHQQKVDEIKRAKAQEAASVEGTFATTITERLETREGAGRAREVGTILSELLVDAAIPKNVFLSSTGQGVNLNTQKPQQVSHGEWEKHMEALNSILAPLLKSENGREYDAICQKERIIVKLDKDSEPYKALKKLTPPPVVRSVG